MKFIDLGLSVKWADMNMGAKTPEDGGNHYTSDEAKTLDVGVPTINELKELQEKCEWTWDARRKGYDVKGPNGNRIFLPTAGHQLGAKIYQAGFFGFYWSSSPDTRHPAYALSVRIDSSGVFRGFSPHYARLSVRTVVKQPL